MVSPIGVPQKVTSMQSMSFSFFPIKDDGGQPHHTILSEVDLDHGIDETPTMWLAPNDGLYHQVQPEVKVGDQSTSSIGVVVDEQVDPCDTRPVDLG